MYRTDMKLEDQASWLAMMDLEFAKGRGEGSVVDQVKEAIEDICTDRNGWRPDELITSVY